jgi:hypothetical protein
MKKTTTYTILSVILCSFCQCRYDATSRISAYLEENESQIEMLRGWDIYFEPERKFWSCRQWYNGDSLLAFVIVRVDNNNNIESYNIGLSHEDSITMAQTVSQHVGTLHQIRNIFKSESIGTHEIEIFNDTMAYNYVIVVGDEKSRYQIILMKHENNTIGHHLYGEWYLRKL